MTERTRRPSHPRRLAAATLGVLLAVGALAQPTAAVAQETTIPVEDLVGWSGVAFDGTSVAPSAPRIAADGHTGAGAVEVLLDTGARTVDGWEMAVRSLDDAPLDAVSFWVRAENVTTVGVQLVDATGQTHQSFLPVPASDGWQELTLQSPVTDPSHSAWGGAGDGIWHGPARQVGFVVNGWARADTAQPTARLLVDDLTVRAADAPSGFALTPGTLGNLFTEGDPLAFPYTTGADTVRWTVTDGDGRVVDEGEEDADGALDLTAPGRGWFSLSVEGLAAGESVGSATTTFAVLAETDVAATATGRYGAATHYGQGWDPASMGALAVGGVAQFRDEVYWSEVETTPGVYDWSRPRAEFLDAARDSGVKPLLLAGYGNPLYDGGNGPVSDEAVSAYAAYAAAMADEFGDMSTGLEIWNEWDLGLGGNTNVAPEHYVDLLAAASPAVKAVAPELPVIGPAVANLNTDWLEQTFRLGALQYLDGIVLHPYSYPVGAEALDETLSRVDALVRQYNGGESIPLWVTELGWPTGTNARAVSESSQAADIAKSAVITAMHDVQRTFIYDLVNDGVDAQETEENFGLLHHPQDPLGAFTPKPAFVSYSTAAGLLLDATATGRDTSVADLWNVSFDTPDGPLRALWSTSDRAVTLGLRGEVVITDLYGASRTVAAGDGTSILLELGEGPVYVQGEVAGVTASETALTLDPAYLGQAVTARWTMDNRAGTADRTFVLRFDDGQEASQTVAAGTTGTVVVELPPASVLGELFVEATLLEDDVELGRLTARTTVGEPVTLVGDQVALADGGSALRLTVGNASAEPVTIDRLTVDLGGSTQTFLDGVTVAAHESATADLPLTGLAGRADWSAVALVGGRELRASGVVVPVDLGAAVDAAHRTIEVDGVLDDLDDLTPIVPVATGRAADDQSARAWYTWDEDDLFLSVEVTDDVHDQPAAGANIWQGDSVQFTVAAGAPGSATGWHELGMALTPAGPQLYRWLAVGEGPGTVAGARVAVERDDAAATTVYEVAVPWVRLTGVRPDAALLSSAFIVNEADGEGRDGYLAWGGGIAAEKDSAQFLPVRLLPAAGTGGGTDPGTEPGTGTGTGTSGGFDGGAASTAQSGTRGLAGTGVDGTAILAMLGLGALAAGALVVARGRRASGHRP
ncbi:sugar-binding protein [Plantibacter sp. lyk4-40-MEA-4]|uniref:sugar-binding protein n=1 Tax=Plantibacter sp. lyk4-40-MEA-4 TaxID=3040298 RepID=UPI002550F2B1|nr:sugar-binding protein [Plantibacter sp. lyk4-40-MEA-4]